MRKTVIVLLSAILLTVLPLSSCNRESRETGGEGFLALTNCRMIDGTGAGPVENAVVLIKDGSIAAAGLKDTVRIPAGADTVDLKGATVLPGFINAHVHRAYDEKQLQQWLAAGVTTVRDEAPMLGGDFLKERDRLSQNIANATIVSATPILTVPGGYGKASFTSAAEASDKVKEYVDRGVDIIKFSIEDNLQGRTWALPALDEVKAIVEAAHMGGRKASVHITHVWNLEWAIEAGVDDIAHMAVEPLGDEIAAEIAGKGIYWVPTLELWSGVSEMHSLNWIDVALQNLSAFRKAGGKVALGTDFAGYTCDFDRGFPITEVTLMKRAGMTNMEIIVAGTMNAAYVCGRENVTGTVEAGKYADLLVVGGDPLTDLEALLDVRMVMHRGVVAVNNPAP